MSCPFLGEVAMAFCGASPFKKPIRVDRLSPESHCAGDAYLECPIYRQRVAEERGEEGSPRPPTGVGGST